MDIIIKKSPRLKGTISVPPSKSYAQRAIALALLLDKIHLTNVGSSDDEKAALDIVSACGCEIEWIGERELTIRNSFQFDTDIILHCGESGLSTRLFSVLMLLNQGKTTITGKGSLLDRPMGSLKEVYDQLEISYQWNDGKIPLTFQGKRNPKNLVIDGSVSSQFITGVLYYLVGLRHHRSIELEIKNPKSIPYINMTIEMLNSVGAKIHWKHQTKIQIDPSNLMAEAKVEIEADWSSASNWIVAAAIDGEIELRGLNPHSLQADRKVIEVVQSFGADVQMFPDRIMIKSKDYKSFNFDAEHCPDLIPILSILAVFGDGESCIAGIHRLKFKESDRMSVVIKILEGIKVDTDSLNNFIKIKGNVLQKKISQSIEKHTFESYEDHRVVMASSILALYLIESKLKGINAVKKSYPNFFQDLRSLGGIIEGY